MQRNMHICRQICIFYARICTFGANVSFAYMHVHIVTALLITFMFLKEYYKRVSLIYTDLVILAWYQFILPPNLVL